MDPIKLSCSSLPRVMLCPASSKHTDYPAGSDSPEARLGRAVHYALGKHLRGEPCSWEETATGFGLEDHAEFYRLCRAGLRCWEQLQQYFPDPVTEYEFKDKSSPFGELTGHADVLSITN